MSDYATCPECSHRFWQAESDRVPSARCPRCGKVFLLHPLEKAATPVVAAAETAQWQNSEPAGSATAVAAAPLSQARLEVTDITLSNEHRPQPTRSVKKKWMLIGITGGVLALGLGVALTFMLLRKGESDVIKHDAKYFPDDTRVIAAINIPEFVDSEAGKKVVAEIIA